MFFSSLRLEYCRKSHPLGLSYQVQNIPDTSISASSDPVSSLSNARLRSSNSWCGKDSPNQWIKIDFEQVLTISGVATQGSGFGKVEKYKMRYSYDGQTWYGYPNNASLQVSACPLFHLTDYVNARFGDHSIDTHEPHLLCNSYIANVLSSCRSKLCQINRVKGQFLCAL